MKPVIKGNSVETGLSLYINGQMEYQAVNLISEYGQKLDGCRYAVASRHDRETMEKMYGNRLNKFRPYIFLTREQYEPIKDSKRNTDRYHRRELRKHECYGFSEEMTEVANKCNFFMTEEEKDALTLIIDVYEEIVYEEKKRVMHEAIESLTETQRRRVMLYYCDGKTFREIADMEDAALASVRDSINAAKKRLEKYFEKKYGKHPHKL